MLLVGMIEAEDELDRGVLNAPAAQWFCFVHDEHSFTYRSKAVIKKKNVHLTFPSLNT